ncbi:MAG: protein kinase [Planctomycetes bacterium]|nr:protein kinase [Planctomycetota bacterium]
MIFEDPQELKQRITEVIHRTPDGAVKVFEDMSNFMAIDAHSVLRIAGNDYLVVGHAREGRFGLDEEPKFWVKSTLDLTTCERKMIKLRFRESFKSRIDKTDFRCMRSPMKESAVLRMMKGHPNFMQGESAFDAAGNPVRILDFIKGPSLYNHLRNLAMSHEVYYHQILPKIMPPVIECMNAIGHLHRRGLHHGDIRADHIILKNRATSYVWIDFDYVVDYPDYDLFCLGNILQQVVGKGRHSLHDIRLRPSEYPALDDTLALNDMSFMLRHRVANLRKLFPHISPELNEILMHFSVGSTPPYDHVDDLVANLRSIFPLDPSSPDAAE